MDGLKAECQRSTSSSQCSCFAQEVTDQMGPIYFLAGFRNGNVAESMGENAARICLSSR